MESETESETATEAATEVESESESETEAVTESESETVVETESESETETVAETEVQTESETEAVTETEAKKTRRKVRKAKTQESEDENGIAVSATPAPMTWNDSASYTDMGQYLSLNDDLSKNLEIYDENGNLVDHYDPDNQTVSGGRFKLNIPFSNEKKEFPENGYLSIKLPDALHIGSSVGVTTLKWADEPDKPDGSNASYLASKYGDAGLFKVDEATNTLYVQMNPDYIRDYPRTVASSIDVWGSFRRSKTGTDGDKEVIKIGNAVLTVKFDGNPIEAEKSVGGYEEGKGFPFAVTVRSYATPDSDVLVTDTLGTNLTLDPGSVQVTDAKGNVLETSKYTISSVTPVDGKEQFVVTLKKECLTVADGSKEPTQVKVTYYAKIKDEALSNPDATTGAISNLDNTAVVKQAGSTDQRTVTAEGSYFVEWIRKAAGRRNNDGTITWTLTVNKDGKANVDGIQVTDTLLGNGLQFDKREKIHVSVKDGTGFDIDWNDPNLTVTDSSWTYDLKEANKNLGKKELTFTYKTLVAGGLSDENAYANTGTVTINDKTVGTDTAKGDGSGSGTGDGGLSKKYVGSVPGDDGKEYQKWQVTIHVPAAGLTDVSVTDTLTGNHKFPDTIEVSDTDVAPKVSATNYKLTADNVERKSDNTLLFKFDKLEGKGSAYDVVITYYTLITTTGKDEIVGNRANLISTEKTGFVDATEEVKNYTFGKTGTQNVTDKTKLDWVLKLSPGFKTTRQKKLIIKDTFSAGQSYVKGSARLYQGDTDVTDDYVLDVVDSGLTVEFTAYGGFDTSSGDFSIRYSTEIKNSELTSFDNSFDVTYDGNTYPGASASVDTSVTHLIKSLDQNATVSNAYCAKWSIEANANGLKIGNDQEATYEIYDYYAPILTIDRSTIVLEKQDTDGQWKKVNASEYQKIFSDNEISPKDNTPAKMLKVVIKTTGEQVYRLRYETLANMTDKKEGDQVACTNYAEFKVGSKEFNDFKEDDVTKEADAGGSTTTKQKTIKIIKASDSGKNLSGVKFTLEHYNGTDWETAGTGTTDDKGVLIFGSLTTGDKFVSVGLTEGDVYRLTETAPEGYLGIEPITFIFDDEKDANANIYKELKVTLVQQNKLPINVTNIELTEKTVEKNWVAGEGADSVTVKLIPSVSNVSSDKVLAYISEVTNNIKTEVELNKAGNWTYKWEKLPKYYVDKQGTAHEITYNVEETKVGDKTLAESGYDSYQTTDGTAKTTTISNVSKKTSLEVKKVWNDNNNGCSDCC